MFCSIIIPLYNKELYIRSAIDSVLHQTWRDFEIVVIDDGSRDSSPAIVAAIEDPRIRLIRQENCGVSKTRNRGIEAARGELICFLDADDWYHPTYLETIVLMAQQYPDNAFYATNYLTTTEMVDLDPGGDNQPCRQWQVIDNYYRSRYELGPFFHTDSFATRKKDLMALQPCFPVGESLGEDQDLGFRLAERLDLIYCDKMLTGYRIAVSGSLMDTEKLHTLPPAFIRLEHRARSGQIKPAQRKYARLVVADARISVARYPLVTNRRAEALQETLKANYAMIRVRWWMTLLLCCIGSGKLMERFSAFRKKIRASTY